MHQRRTALVFGGCSTEHNISIISAKAIASNINRESWDLYPLYISPDGTWYEGKTACAILELDIGALLHTASPDDIRHQLQAVTQQRPQDRFSFDFRQAGIDIALPIVHGAYGEDGRLQGLLDMFAIPYTGCDVRSSALTMDKETTKICAGHHGLATAPYRTVLRHDFSKEPDKIVQELETAATFPLFIKPASQGSSIGISKVHRPDELLPAFEEAFGYDTKVLVEDAVEGSEIEVAVLGNDDPVVSVPGEIEPGSDFYDFTDKYVSDSAGLYIPARISAEQKEHIRSCARRAFRALGCSGMARVDFFLERGSGQVILNEINTVPGFTSISMYPKLLEASGIGFSELIDRLLELALEKRCR
ncbi:D-alanine--D-alanine ligase [Prosthecochloris sp. N3]|uniref:D-alanine--D-alanine ligase n=1 Tax=Prosthecochloris ethylica TaxID=2743976 RepID=A0ABR9XQF4_9CHLB|nr:MULTISPECIES: D-alanine--D-alanine ligase family protein [Prosthecochloris]MBF0585485.1 D-alanine--D-alanine ligase [Prosthecochloris ethylica]MBF0636271.1 D-alanine--D-alanine ligase [Prosthecochloris ethylica]NUK46715.1 D-alanine--D-alanine ligase [Prosthecochloris ethylica]RNA64700.1 D-alanine--D-alanine ligase [Prosthecochloris sp. ZM_2]